MKFLNEVRYWKKFSSIYIIYYYMCVSTYYDQKYPWSFFKVLFLKSDQPKAQQSYLQYSIIGLDYGLEFMGCNYDEYIMINLEDSRALSIEVQNISIG